VTRLGVSPWSRLQPRGELPCRDQTANSTADESRSSSYPVTREHPRNGGRGGYADHRKRENPAKRTQRPHVERS
jgi:hypothetical protein